MHPPPPPPAGGGGVEDTTRLTSSNEYPVHPTLLSVATRQRTRVVLPTADGGRLSCTLWRVAELPVQADRPLIGLAKDEEMVAV